MEHIINELHTVQDFIRFSTSQFNRSEIYLGHGNSDVIDEARQLVLGSLDLPLTIPTEFYAANLTTDEKAQLLENITVRIEQRIPTAYITNRSWFCGYEFYVDERVLIPRSPISELIEHHFAGFIEDEPQNILDLCTGSGCIGIACAHEFTNAEVDLVDISPDALAVAEINVQAHQLSHRVLPILSDLFDNVPDIQYDIIVTNPPYVDKEDMDDLPQEYQVEPELALEAGFDGLDIVKRILNEAASHLSTNGILICEVGNSAVALRAQYPEIPFNWIKFNNGGEGIFSLTRQQLIQIQEIL